MSLQSKRQLENTRAKLKLIEDRLRDLDREPVANVRTREMTRLSLKKLANQLKEEIVRFEAHRPQARSDDFGTAELSFSHVLFTRTHAFCTLTRFALIAIFRQDRHDAAGEELGAADAATMGVVIRPGQQVGRDGH